MAERVTRSSERWRRWGTEAAMETMSRSLLCVPARTVVSVRRAREGAKRRKIGEERDVQREACLIAAVIDAQGLESGQLFEARNHSLCQRRRQAEGQLLHLRAVWEHFGEGIRDADGL